MTTDKTYWQCEACEMVGGIEYEAGSDVYHVLYLLEEAHGAASPACTFDVRRVRVSRTLFAAPASALPADTPTETEG